MEWRGSRGRIPKMEFRANDKVLTIRLADVADCQALAKLKLAVWYETYAKIYPQAKFDQYSLSANEAKFKKLVADPNRHLYVVLDGADPIGYMCCGAPIRGFRDFTQEIGLLYLLKKYQRMGLGTALFNLAKDIIGQHHVDRFFVSCNKYNLSAQKFYLKCGGKPIYVDPDNDDHSLPQVKFEYRIEKVSGKQIRKDLMQNFPTAKPLLKTIDRAFAFYHFPKKYQPQAYRCLQQVFGNDSCKQNFFRVYETLYTDQSNEFRKLWKFKDVETLFGSSTPFATNLMILLGMPFHQSQMKTLQFNRKQRVLHRKRVKDCFVNDIETRGYQGVRISQMIWAAYFIRGIIIEVGILQYEFDSSIDKIKIHIPQMPRLDLNQVKESLSASKLDVEKYFHLTDKLYVCHSWLLSQQLSAILDDTSNIKKFQTLFRIKDGEDCINDLFNHVYQISGCDDLNQLPEQTALQRKIKAELLQGTVFKLGCGELI